MAAHSERPLTPKGMPLTNHSEYIACNLMPAGGMLFGVSGLLLLVVLLTLWSWSGTNEVYRVLSLACLLLFCGYTPLGHLQPPY